jgi:hypothetical protein
VEFAKKIPLPGDAAISETARSLRIYGVLLCTKEGIDLFERCLCFQALAAEKTKDELKQALIARLDVLEAAGGRGDIPHGPITR